MTIDCDDVGKASRAVCLSPRICVHAFRYHRFIKSIILLTGLTVVIQYSCILQCRFICLKIEPAYAGPNGIQRIIITFLVKQMATIVRDFSVEQLAVIAESFCNGAAPVFRVVKEFVYYKPVKITYVVELNF